MGFAPALPSGARRIGLLGGSFNPAHAGHVHLSLQAMKKLKLDAVWWLVSPQNPLKSRSETAPYAQRLKQARKLARRHPAIHVLSLEQELGLYYTADTLEYLLRHLPQCRFVWLMGADNLQSLHRWRRWRDIVKSVPVAIFDRASFSHKALRSPGGLAFRGCRLPESQAAFLADSPAPSWCYLFMPLHPESSTRLRNLLGAAGNGEYTENS